MKKLVLLIALLFVTSFSQDQDTLQTITGLKYIILEEGNGLEAEANKNVEVHYTGYLPDGRIFDSSVKRNEPIEFVLGTGQVIEGWEEGIDLMKVGDKLRLIIPPDLAYGDSGAGEIIPPKAILIFDVELVSVSEAKTSIADVMLDIILRDSVEVAVYTFHELKKLYPDDYNFKEAQLNMLGYQLLQNGRTGDAIEMFKLNVQQYPESANVYDSLGEAYNFEGEKAKAVENYKKSLELDPNNENAKQRLEEIQEE